LLYWGYFRKKDSSDDVFDHNRERRSPPS